MNPIDENRLYNNIAWTGNSLAGPEYLACDLSFRRHFSSTFAEPNSFSRWRIQAITEEPEFQRLLLQAIRDSRPELEDWITKNLHRAPDSVHGFGLPDMADAVQEARRIWTARLLVFNSLFADDDFVHYVVESDRHRRDLKKVWEWGQKIKPRPKEGAQVTSDGIGIGSLLKGLYAPLAQSLVYVVPVVIGTHYIADHIIEKQREVSEIRSEKPFLVQVPSPELPASVVQNIDSSINNVSSEVSILNERVAVIAAVIDKTHTGPQSAQVICCTFQGNIPSKLALNVEAGPKLDARLSESATFFSRLLSPEGMTLRLANAEPMPCSGTCDPKLNVNQPEKGAGLQLTIRQNDMNVHQSTVPFQDNGPSQPLFVALSDGEVRQLQVTEEKNNKDSRILRMCSNNAPYRILLASRDEEFTQGCKTKDLKTINVTKTPQYVPELKAYISLDAFSKKRFIVAGSRKVVLQIVPRDSTVQLSETIPDSVSTLASTRIEPKPQK